MTDERYKQLMESLGMPNSRSLLGVLQQVANEVSQDQIKRQVRIEAHHVAEASIQMVVNAALNLIQSDPHQWSKRPCPTCRVVTDLIGRPFGCSLYAQQHKDTK